jgi:hypothetical protein
MNVVSIAGIVLATTVVSRIMFLYLESRAAYRRRMWRSG